MSDIHAAMKQIHEDALKLKTDIDSAESAGADPLYIKEARRFLSQTVSFLVQGIEKGDRDRGLMREILRREGSL